MITTASRGGFFYGWYIAGICMLIYFFTNGMSIWVPQNLFPRFMETFDATAAAVSFSTGTTLLLAGLLAPFAGALIDRFGVVRVMRSGLIIMAVAFAFYPFSQSLTHLYVLHAVLALGLILAGLMPCVVLLSNWFVKRRGAVIGLLVASSSLAGAVLPVAISPLVLDPEFGWRWGFGALSIAFILFAVLPGLTKLKADPADVGQAPDGLPPGDVSAEESEPDGVSFSVALRSRSLWFLAVGSACLWYSFQSVNSQATIFFEQEAGLTPRDATLLFSVIYWFSFAGKFLFGALSDHIAKRRVLMVASVIMLVGTLILFDPSGSSLSLTRGILQLIAFAVVFGLGFGGCFTMIQLVTVETFGQRALGKILGIIILIDGTAGFLGTVVTSQIRTTTGDYLLSFQIVVVVAVIGMLGIRFIKPVAGYVEAHQKQA
jgi:MFS family permease